MNAPLPSRLLPPILGSGSDAAGRIFTVAGEAVSFAPVPHALASPDGAPAPPDFVILSGLSAGEPDARPIDPAPAPEPRSAAPVAAPVAAEPDEIVAPPPAATDRPTPTPLPPVEHILVERLGPLALHVTGTSRDDRLFGGLEDDRLDGLAGDDILLGSPGRDLLYGGPGHDTIRYDLLRAEVRLDTRFQRISLEDGEDQYDGIEVLDLRDGDWILTAGDPAALVQRLWLAATGHAPSAAEMIREAAALQAGGTAEALAGRLASGAGEAAQLRIQAALDAPREGRLDQPVWLPDAEAMLLTRLCDLALATAPDRGAYRHWLDELEGGTPAASVAAEILATPQAAHLSAQALVAAASDWML